MVASSVARSVIRRPRNGNSMTPPSANSAQIAAVSRVWMTSNSRRVTFSVRRVSPP